MTNEELRQEVKRLEEQIKDLKIKLEEKAEKKPYELKVPEDIGNYYYVDEYGDINLVLDTFHNTDYEKVYKRGLAFKTREEAEQFDKERILLFKFHKWAEEHNGGWKPELNNEYEKKYFIIYNVQGKIFEVFHTWQYNYFLKLPYFKSVEIAEQFIEEFGDEIKEVFC